MKKGKKIITTIAISGLLLCSGLIVSNAYTESLSNSHNTATVSEYNTDKQYSHTQILAENAGEKVLTLQNKKLEEALKNLLGVSTLKANSISMHNDYMEYQVEPGTGPFIADKVCLDLSNTGVTDITELCLFDWPSTLKAINLANNGITNEDLPSLMNFPTYKSLQEIEYKGTTLTCFSNLYLTLAKDAEVKPRINLCFNNIDLTTISENYLKDDRYIYGIQNMNNLHTSGLVTKQELSNTNYYFTDDNYIYVHPSFFQTPYGQDRQPAGYVIGNVKNITNNEKYGKYEILINGGDTGYFKGWSQSYTFTAFKANVAEDYFVEKLELFNLPKNKLEFDGVAPTWELRGSPVTNKVGNFKLNIHITTPTAERLIYVDYQVKDTTAPVIELIGQAHMAIRETSVPFNDPGVKGLDSNGAEDITPRVHSNAQEVFEVVDGKYVKKTYVITYTLTDLAGNTAKPITRTVTVQENVLDTIIIKSQTDLEKIQKDKDIVLEVKPDSNIKLDRYSDLKYYWYVDGILQNEVTLGHKIDGKSTMTFFFDSIGEKEIKVVLKAKDSNGNTVEVHSDTFILNVHSVLKDNDNILLATAITIGIILVIILAGTIVKYRKAHAKSHTKTSAYHKKEKKKPANNGSNGPEIQVIRDYKGDGGNANTKPDQSQNKDK